MLKILNKIPKIINGVIFAAFEMAGEIYRAAPIKTKQDVVIVGLPKGKPVTVKLSGRLKFDMLVTSLDADIAEDDGKELQLDTRNNYRFSYVQIIAHVKNPEDGKVVKTLAFFISSYPAYTNQIILSPDYIYELVANQDVNSITFTGEPVHKPDPIKIIGGVELAS